jgi:hypothetical protein
MFTFLRSHVITFLTDAPEGYISDLVEMQGKIDMITNLPAEIVELLNDGLITEELAKASLKNQGLSETEIGLMLEGHTGYTEADLERMES